MLSDPRRRVRADQVGIRAIPKDSCPRVRDAARPGGSRTEPFRESLASLASFLDGAGLDGAGLDGAGPDRADASASGRGSRRAAPRRELEERLLWKSRGIERRLARDRRPGTAIAAVRASAAPPRGSRRPAARSRACPARADRHRQDAARETLARELRRPALARAHRLRRVRAPPRARASLARRRASSDTRRAGISRALAEIPRASSSSTRSRRRTQVEFCFRSSTRGVLTDGRGRASRSSGRSPSRRRTLIEMAGAARRSIRGARPCSDAIGSRRSRARPSSAASARIPGPDRRNRPLEEPRPRAPRRSRAELRDLAIRARRAGRSVAFPPEIARWIAERGFSAEHGARGIARAVRRDVEAPLADLVLEGSLGDAPDGIARARIESDRVVFEFER